MSVRLAAILTALVWLLITGLHWHWAWDDIAALRMPDADDYLRLLQATDWLAGQPWYDVAQHRINPDAPAAMHWSRLVDLPIAAVIAIASPLTGPEAASRIAGALIPSFTHGLIIALVALITARLVGRAWAPVAAFYTALCVVLFSHVMPMRLDHHGWQAVGALTAFWALLDEQHARRSGLIAGAACALWLHISIEGLPMTVAIAAFLGVRWLMDAQAVQRLGAFTLGVLAASLALRVAVTPPAAVVAIECDQVSGPHLAALAALCGTLALGVFALRRLGRWGRRPAARLAVGAAAGLAGLVVFLPSAPACAAGPFDMVDPLVKSFWLDNVRESKPLLALHPAQIVGYALPVLLGLAGALLGWRTQGPRWAAPAWLILVGLLLMSFVMVRMGGVAQAFAIPGMTMLTALAVAQTRRIGVMPARVLATVAVALIASPLPAALIAAHTPRSVQALRAAPSCFEGAAWDMVRDMPSARLMAPLDIGPRILAHAPHSVLATGHHRNADAMAQVYRAFAGSPEAALHIARRHHVKVIAYCPIFPETDMIMQRAPDGFLAQLQRGAAIPGLAPLGPSEPGRMRLFSLEEQGIAERMGPATPIGQ